MDAIREAASVALSLRKAAGLRVRLPLSELTIAVEQSDSLAKYSELIADELNVKKISVVKASDEVAKQFGLSKNLAVNARALGPRLGKAVQEVIQTAKAGNWRQVDGAVVVGETLLQEGEFEITLQAIASEGNSAGVTSAGFVLLNTVVTDELEQEGAARDAIRHIQQARKDSGLDVSDRIHLRLLCDEKSKAALEKHSELVSEETLATKLELSIGAGTLPIGEAGLIQIELVKQ
jgi:isoleucyl-tRNA synthetase